MNLSGEKAIDRIHQEGCAQQDGGGIDRSYSSEDNLHPFRGCWVCVGHWIVFAQSKSKSSIPAKPRLLRTVGGISGFRCQFSGVPARRPSLGSDNPPGGRAIVPLCY